ncbi:unnamed protein product [Strongylus vulgaris]|uniref:Uncharacterized protein n=1 Tax=Strongylus vulgaris TaxID=40348 RepID=A0A3P7I9K7_STRVU|nr:unnamed protein product [Strongylus vulgaris]
MGFGERKAYFLSIRPNPKFATWFGKKKHLPSPDSNKNKILLPMAPVPVRQLPEKSPREEDDDDDDSRRSVKKGINAKNPFIKGCPFWTVATGLVDNVWKIDNRR